MRTCLWEAKPGGRGGGVKEEKWGWGERRWGRLGHGGCVCVRVGRGVEGG